MAKPKFESDSGADRTHDLRFRNAPPAPRTDGPTREIPGIREDFEGRVTQRLHNDADLTDLVRELCLAVIATGKPTPAARDLLERARHLLARPAPGQKGGERKQEQQREAVEPVTFMGMPAITAKAVLVANPRTYPDLPGLVVAEDAPPAAPPPISS
jgi:hypothetical protein